MPSFLIQQQEARAVSTMQAKYEWKRFFCKRDDEDPVLVEDAYLYDPQDGEGYVNPQVANRSHVISWICRFGRRISWFDGCHFLLRRSNLR